MSLPVGTLNSRVRIKEPDATQDEAGQPIPAWSTVADVWANIRHMNGIEMIRAGEETSIVRASIRIRRRSGVNASMRVTDLATGTDYQIKAVLPDEVDRDKINLVCETIYG